MAKKSKVVKNIQRQEIVNRFSKKRKELKAIIKDPNSTFLDNSAGAGNFLVGLKNRLLQYHSEGS